MTPTSTALSPPSRPVVDKVPALPPAAPTTTTTAMPVATVPAPAAGETAVTEPSVATMVARVEAAGVEPGSELELEHGGHVHSLRSRSPARARGARSARADTSTPCLPARRLSPWSPMSWPMRRPRTTPYQSCSTKWAPQKPGPRGHRPMPWLPAWSSTSWDSRTMPRDPGDARRPGDHRGRQYPRHTFVDNREPDELTNDLSPSRGSPRHGRSPLRQRHDGTRRLRRERRR